MGASLWLSLAAILIAVGSLVIAVRADRRAGRAERREEEDFAARRRAQPIILPRGGSGGPTADPVRHEYLIRNGGAAPITELWLWIEDAEGRAVSSRSGGRIVVGPGEATAIIAVELRQPLPDPPLRLMVEWRDRDGSHVDPTGIEPPPHH